MHGGASADDDDPASALVHQESSWKWKRKGKGKEGGHWLAWAWGQEARCSVLSLPFPSDPSSVLVGRRDCVRASRGGVTRCASRVPAVLCVILTKEILFLPWRLRWKGGGAAKDLCVVPPIEKPRARMAKGVRERRPPPRHERLHVWGSSREAEERLAGMDCELASRRKKGCLPSPRRLNGLSKASELAGERWRQSFL